MSSTSSASSVSVNLALLPNTTPSLCIPRVFKNITRERIISTINELNLGSVTRVDIVPSGGGDKFQRVFIHIDWNNGEVASRARTRLLTGKEIKIIYDDPWFWKISANRASKRVEPSLVFDSDSDDAAAAAVSDRNHRPRPNVGRHHNMRHGRSKNKNKDKEVDAAVDAFGRDLSMRKERERELEREREQELEQEREQEQEQETVQETSRVLDVDKPSLDAGFKVDYGEQPLPVLKRRRVVVKKPM
jgi:hypothetical protein